MTTILGISAFYHDSAAALVVDGEIVAAAQEERFTREKYDPAFPRHAIDYCLAQARIPASDLDYLAFYDKPVIKFDRLVETQLRFAPVGFRSFSMAVPRWLKKKLFTRQAIRRGCRGANRARILFMEHHESHAASAFFPSPFDEAAILTLDGVGEWSTATYGTGAANKISLNSQLTFPHSLGLLYSAFTYYCGFKVNSGEYKLMGLAPYGRPVYRDQILKHLVDLKPDGSLWLDMQYFNYCQGLTMTSERFHELFGGPPRKTDTDLDQRHMDLAASIQAVTEEVVLRMGRDIHAKTGMKNLVLAGGVALNCVANGRLQREGPFESIWIQPAAGDAGGALGAALFVWHQLLDKPRRPAGRSQQHASFLGPSFSTSEIGRFLDDRCVPHVRYDDEQLLLDATAALLADGKVVGWFQGRSEFGPRALGARSILGDPRSAAMQTLMNVKIKFRESFRPFAPAVLREHVHEWFQMAPDADSPYMLIVAPVLERHRLALDPAASEALRTDPDLLKRLNVPRSTIPAVTHVDNSARVQTVDERHGRYYRLLQAFNRRTGCPVLVNTSFNLSWEPIVQTPTEAYHTFMQSEMDALVLEDFILLKAEQPLGLRPWTARHQSAGITTDDSPWADPLSGGPLSVSPEGAHSPVSGASYAVEGGIPRLFVLPDATRPQRPRRDRGREGLL